MLILYIILPTLILLTFVCPVLDINYAIAETVTMTK